MSLSSIPFAALSLLISIASPDPAFGNDTPSRFLVDDALGHLEHSSLDTLSAATACGAETTPKPHLFCTDPVTAVCVSGERRETLRSAVRRNVMTVAGQAYHRSAGVRSSEREAYLVVLEEILKEQLQVDQAFLDSLNGTIERALVTAVGRNAASSVDARERMIERIGRLRIRLATRLPNRQSTVALACGRDWLGTDAKFDGGTIWVCPGLLFDINIRTRDRRDFVNSLIDTLSHEVGHGLDYRQFPRDFAPFRRCVETRQAELLKEGWTSWFPGNVGRKLDDISADLWEAETSSVRFEQAGTEPARMLAALQGSYGYLCDEPANASHPSGDFRIGVTLGQNPRLRQLFGCAVQGRTTCTLRGEERY